MLSRALVTSVLRVVSRAANKQEGAYRKKVPGRKNIVKTAIYLGESIGSRIRLVMVHSPFSLQHYPSSSLLQAPENEAQGSGSFWPLPGWLS
jgi:hypothetical protein